MKKKLILYTSLTVFCSLVTMFVLGIFVTKNNNLQQSTETVKNYCSIYADSYSGINNISAPPEGVRFTVIDAFGDVLYDSFETDITAMDNHLSREEVLAAIELKPKTAIRKSETFGTEMIYYALRVDSGESYVIVRVGVAVSGVNAYVYKTVPLSLFIMLFALVAAIIASIFLSEKALLPINEVKSRIDKLAEGKYEPMLVNGKDEELNNIMSDVNAIGEKLEANFSALKEEKAKLNYILDNVSDAIVVFGKEEKIELVNSAACAMFSLKGDFIGKTIDYLTADKKISEGLSACYKGEGSTFVIEQNALYYLVTIRATDSGRLILVANEITAAKESEKRRAEFFANASHELKTPLTAIIGFSEILSMKNKDDGLNNYVAQIKAQSERMLNLISDMLSLSNLENEEVPKLTKIDTENVVNEVIAALLPQAEEKNVKITAEGNATLFIGREHFYQLVKNLAENAVRYNKEGGKVEISVKKELSLVKLIVSDNGIGIDAPDQVRIYERFYRTNKSRSRDKGGTGLGLAIVKHICKLYSAEIDLKSKLGDGTTFTITFKNSV